MRIAVYSGSFNPLHIGHEAIIRFLTEKAGFDLVYLVVTPQNPFKDAHSLPLGKTRFDAAVEAVARHPELVKFDEEEYRAEQERKEAAHA